MFTNPQVHVLAPGVGVGVGLISIQNKKNLQYNELSC